MAQPLQSITLSAPGFMGINTQDSPLNADQSFAAIANNCVIDRFGRIGARKGYAYVTTDATAISGGTGIYGIHESVSSTGTSTILSVGNNKILSGTTTLVDETPAAYTITSDRWKMVSLADHTYFFQRGYEPLLYDTATGAVIAMTSHAGHAGTPPEANEALAAYGRIFCADFTANKSTVYWSDLLNGIRWTGGSSGSINIQKHWPAGYDEIVALAAHNNFLVIFGKRSILLFSGANDPSTMVLQDAIAGMGCLAQCSVVSTGDEILFLSSRGVESLGRVIQEKSAPTFNITKNVRDDIIAALAVETGYITAVFSPEEGFYLLNFPSLQTTYCIDNRGQSEDGAHRVTTWSGIVPLSCYRTQAGVLYLGKLNGIAQYSGYVDGTEPYLLEYFSNPLGFGQPAVLKFLKKFALTVITDSSMDVVLNWSFDYSAAYIKRTITLTAATGAEFGIAEYSIGEYGGGGDIMRPAVNASGSGSLVTVGIQVSINGGAFSIQQLDILALLGRLY